MAVNDPKARGAAPRNTSAGRNFSSSDPERQGEAALGTRPDRPPLGTSRDVTARVPAGWVAHRGRPGGDETNARDEAELRQEAEQRLQRRNPAKG